MDNVIVNHFGAAANVAPTVLAVHSIGGVAPGCVLEPDCPAAVAAALRFAAAHKLAVVPCGGMTAQGRGAPPPTGFIALKSSKFNALVHHEPGDMVATVQSGMRIDDFQDQLRAKGQWLPIDAPSGATIGGLIAANVFGPRAHGYGTLRDMVLGMTVVNGDGVLRKTGSKVVKSVTGYALEKLYIGSDGALAFVVDATFKLRPLSIGGRFFKEPYATLAEGLQALRAVGERNLPLETLQLVDPERSLAPRPTLFVGAAGTETELDRIESELRAALPGRTLAASKYSENAEQTRVDWTYALSHEWGGRGQPILDSARVRSMPGATLRFGCVRSKLEAALNAILSGRSGTPMSVGLTGGFVDLRPLSGAAAAEIGKTLDALGVNFAFENVAGIDVAKPYGTARPEWKIMRQIKSALDPQGVLNAGRWNW
jgi:glycolate oxidase FAD binding subunit